MGAVGDFFCYKSAEPLSLQVQPDHVLKKYTLHIAARQDLSKIMAKHKQDTPRSLRAHHAAIKVGSHRVIHPAAI
jgi:hypothetical protein